MNGIINVFKPKGITSHGVVSRIRRILNIKRVGHTGTLDPNVTGVLPICVGKATRVSEYVLDKDKAYRGELTLGVKTDSQDFDGKVLATSSVDVQEQEIIEVFNNYKGRIKQIPPMHSAVRHKGKKLYELAREGIVVERKERDANIYSLDILNICENRILFDVCCSKGTYIRTLCNDIGDDLNTYGYMSHLVRTKVDPFTIDKAYSLEAIEMMYNEGDLSFFEPMDRAVGHLARIDVEKCYEKKLLNGMKIVLEDKSLSVELDYRVYLDGEFVGIGNVIVDGDTSLLKMKKVLI